MKKQLIDQGAHFLIGMAVTYLLSMKLDDWQAIALLAIFAGAREIWQHYPDKPGEGSVLDMFFWILGAIVGVLI